MQETQDILSDIGLTGAEIKVFVALLELGTASAGEVVAVTLAGRVKGPFGAPAGRERIPVPLTSEYPGASLCCLPLAEGPEMNWKHSRWYPL